MGMGGGQSFGKIMIFKCHYKLPSWSYIHIVNMFLVVFDQLNTLRKFSEPFQAQKPIWRWLFHQRPVDTKNGFFDPPMMSFAFLGMIFGGKGLEIDTYKPPKCICSYHTHVVNTRWPKWSRKPKFTFLSYFDVKNSIKWS